MLEAAEGICSARNFLVDASPAETLSDLPVFEILTRLVEKSLVVVSESHIPGEGKQIRYSLLETLRQYGATQLDAVGETAAARQQHLQWHLTLAETAEEALRGPQQELWLARLEREHDNLRAALKALR